MFSWINKQHFDYSSDHIPSFMSVSLHSLRHNNDEMRLNNIITMASMCHSERNPCKALISHRKSDVAKFWKKACQKRRRRKLNFSRCKFVTSDESLWGVFKNVILLLYAWIIWKWSCLIVEMENIHGVNWDLINDNILISQDLFRAVSNSSDPWSFGGETNFYEYIKWTVNCSLEMNHNCNNKS